MLGFILIPTLAALDPDRSLFQYQCQSWSRVQGLPVSGVKALAQTQNGFIWLGTQKGLVRFDGVNFELEGIFPRKEPRSIVVNCLEASSQGGIWFGLQESGYGYFDGRNKWILGADAIGRLTGNVNDILEISSGDVLTGASGNSTWSRRDGATEPVFPMLKDGLDHDGYNITAVYEDSQGRIWMGAAQRGLFYFQEGEFRKVSGVSNDPDLIFSIVEGKKGQIWLGTQVGLRCLDANLQPKEVDFPGVQVQSLLVDHHGVLWIGTIGNGLACWKNGTFSWFVEKDGLADNYVQALLEDREGSLWIGTRTGLSQLSDVKFPTFTERDGLGAPYVQSVSASPRGGLWASTSKGLIYYDGQSRLYSTETGLKSSYVKRAYESRNGDVYVTGGRHEVEILSENRVVARHPTQSMPVAMAEDETSMIVSAAGELFRVGRNFMTPYDFEDGVKPELYWILNLTVAQDGSLWVASVNGVCRIQGGQFQHWTKADGLISNDVRWVCEDDNEVVWAGLDAGIACFKDGQVLNIGREQGLFDGNVNSIVPDEQGNLWLNSSRGLYRLSRPSLDKFIQGNSKTVDWIVYDSPDSVRPADTSKQEQSGCRTTDGRIWFPSLDGVIMIDPNNIHKNLWAPAVWIESVIVNKEPQDDLDQLILDQGATNLEVHYTALSYISPRQCQFKYRLLDHEDFQKILHGVDKSTQRLDATENLLFGAISASRTTGRCPYQVGKVAACRCPDPLQTRQAG